MRKYRCLSCSAEYSVSDHRFKCDCGGAFELVHDHEFAREKDFTAIFKGDKNFSGSVH